MVIIECNLSMLLFFVKNLHAAAKHTALSTTYLLNIFLSPKELVEVGTIIKWVYYTIHITESIEACRDAQQHLTKQYKQKKQ